MFRLLVMQAVLAVGGRTLVYLELGDGSIQEKGRLDLEHDIACLDVTPVGQSLQLLLHFVDARDCFNFVCQA